METKYPNKFDEASVSFLFFGFILGCSLHMININIRNNAINWQNEQSALDSYWNLAEKKNK